MKKKQWLILVNILVVILGVRVVSTASEWGWLTLAWTVVFLGTFGVALSLFTPEKKALHPRPDSFEEFWEKLQEYNRKRKPENRAEFWQELVDKYERDFDDEHNLPAGWTVEDNNTPTTDPRFVEWQEWMEACLCQYPDEPMMAVTMWEKRMLDVGFEFGNTDEEGCFLLTRGTVEVKYRFSEGRVDTDA